MPYTIPVMNLTCNQWSCPLPLPNVPMAGAPVHANLACGTRLPRESEVRPIVQQGYANIDLVINFLPPYRQYFDYINYLVPAQDPTQATVFELPPGSGQFFLLMETRIAATGFPNEHMQCYCSHIWKNGLKQGL